ncbi:MAG: hypothetical protein AB7O39_03230 [Flavobacteriaceae bacterium]
MAFLTSASRTALTRQIRAAESSARQQAALNASIAQRKAEEAAETLDAADVGLGNVDNTSDADKPISDSTQAALNAKAPIESPTFSGTVNGISKGMVGLGNADNTADADKPVSTAQQTALDGKLNTWSSVPASASDTGTAGQIARDADYVYVCVATDTWKRAALTTW